MTDKALLKTVTAFAKGVTQGNSSKKCYMVSYPLSSYLSMIGVDNELVEGEVETTDHIWGHWWIKLPDNRIIDATASQFTELNMPAVYFGELPKQYKENTR